METSQPMAVSYWRQQIENALLAPIRAMRLEYLPLLMVYFAYGATGLDGGGRELLDQERASPGRRPSWRRLAVWFTLPWTIKMVFGELVDTVPLLGSQRRVYVFIGASLVACRFVLLAGAAGGWITVLLPNELYVVASLLSVTGLVLQDVVADAMSTEVVPRTNPDGTPAPQGGDRPRPRHGAGAGAAGAVVRHLRRRRAVGLAGADAVLPDRVPARPHRAA